MGPEVPNRIGPAGLLTTQPLLAWPALGRNRVPPARLAIVLPVTSGCRAFRPRPPDE